MLYKHLLLATALTVDALPNQAATQQSTVSYTEWAAPGPDDARSPCPALNTLANHGILPRDGRHITLPILEDALLSALNVGPDLAKFFFYGATLLNLTKDGELSLSDLRKHNAIEHDGSLSRADASTGDNFSFNSTVFDSYLAQLGDGGVITTALAGKARMFRIKTEQKRDPEFKYGLKQQIISNGETSLILGIFGDIDNGNANKEHVRLFFEQERLPVQEGWKRPEKGVNVINTALLTAKVLRESGETLEDGKVVLDSDVLAAYKWLMSHWSS